ENVQEAVVGTGKKSDTQSNSAGTSGGVTAQEGINGSRAKLPFGLDPATTPVLGSFHTGDQPTSQAISAWYSLPAPTDDELLVVSAAGRITPANFQVQFGTEFDGRIQPVGKKIVMMDIGPSPSWRNLRLPMDRAPEGATAVRIT